MNQHTYFRSSGYLDNEFITTESGIDINLTKLPPFLRTLLVTDGTVTKSLEAWFWEKVKIESINNYLEVLKHPIAGLEVEIGDKVLQREVILKGVKSNTIFAKARSSVALKYLPEEIRSALQIGEIGIGELLREKGVETYRDIFNINYFSDISHSVMSNSELPNLNISDVNSLDSKTIKADDTLLSSIEGDTLARSYRIRVNKHPAIIVTEYFPVNIYK